MLFRSPYYQFDHWLKEAIIRDILELYEIPNARKPVFIQCNRNKQHTHLNLSMRQIDQVREKLMKYQVENQDKLAYYYCYSTRSKEFCLKLSNLVHHQLKDILWNTKTPAYDHEAHDHGCLVKMNDATPRKNVFCVELENQKQFFNIFNEIEKSKNDPNYFQEKLNLINKSLTLVQETMKQLLGVSR